MTENVVSATTDFTAAATRPSTVVTVKALVPEGAGGVATGAIFLRVFVCEIEREKREEEREREREREEERERVRERERERESLI